MYVEAENLEIASIFVGSTLIPWWWWIYPTHFWGWGRADQLRGVPVIGRLPTDGTRGLEVRGCGRIWPDADGPVQGSQARDVKNPVILARPTLWR